MEIRREHQINFWYIILAFIGVMLIESLLFQPAQVKTIPYSEFARVPKGVLLVGPTGTGKTQLARAVAGEAGAWLHYPASAGGPLFPMDRAELVNRMTVLLGGRSAESLVFDQAPTGAADDLGKATEIARSMVVRLGMDETLGQVSCEPESAPLLGAAGAAEWRPRRHGEETAAAIDKAVRELIDAAFQKAVAVLTTNRALLSQAATELLAKETFSAEELRAVAGKLSRKDLPEKIPKVGIGLAAASRIA